MKANIEFKKLLDSLNSRAAIKNFTPHPKGVEVDKETQEMINITKEVIRLSPSSFGLQPYKFLFITNQEILEELKQHSYGQAQITDSHFLTVFCASTQVDEESVDRYIELTSQTQGIAKEKLLDLAKAIKNTLSRYNEKEKFTWATKQAYIALGNAITSLSLLGIDTCPIEGINPQAYDRVLGLSDKKVSSVVVLAVGVRGKEDPSHTRAKVRFPKEALFIDYK